MSANRDVYRAVQDNKNVAWPEASCLAHLWQGVEDVVLTAMTNYTAQHPYQHLSLHFDGLRIDKARVQLAGGVSEFCVPMSNHALEQAGYHVTIVEKLHFGCQRAHCIAW